MKNICSVNFRTINNCGFIDGVARGLGKRYFDEMFEIVYNF